MPTTDDCNKMQSQDSTFLDPNELSFKDKPNEVLYFTNRLEIGKDLSLIHI